MHRSRIAAALVAGGLLLVGCSAAPAATSPGSAAASSSTGAAFPVSVKSCDETLTFTKAPTKVVMLDDKDASVLAELGLLNVLVGRAGNLRPDAYDAQTLATLKAVPVIKSTALDTGGAKVSTETILATGADLVIGYDSGVDRDALRQAGVPLYSPDALCANYSVTKASFQLVDNEVTNIAAIFGVPDKGKKVIDSLNAQVAALGGTNANRGTAAALYITPGSKDFYAYGTSSMVQPIFEANGFTNSYADQTKRVFDASMEDLLKRNPASILLLYADGTPEAAKSTFEGFAGASQLAAVKNGHVMVMAFSLTDPPSPASIKGAVTLGSLIKG